MPKDSFSLHFETSQDGGVAAQLFIIQNLLSQLPEVGQVYAPGTHPDAHMRVKRVSVSLHRMEGEEDAKPSGFILCCNPDDPNDEYPGLLLDEWQKFQFTRAV